MITLDDFNYINSLLAQRNYKYHPYTLPLYKHEQEIHHYMTTYVLNGLSINISVQIYVYKSNSPLSIAIYCIIPTKSNFECRFDSIPLEQFTEENLKKFEEYLLDIATNVYTW